MPLTGRHERFGAVLGSPPAWGLLTAVLVTLAALVGLRLQADGIALIWPAAGVAAGLMLTSRGKNRWAVAGGIVFGLLLGNTTQDRSLATLLVFVGGNIVQASALAYVLDRYRDRRFGFDDPRSVTRFLAAALLLPALVGLPMALGLRWSGHATGGFADVWWIWFSSHAIGIIALAPSVMLLPRLSLRALEGQAEDLVLVTAFAIAALVLLGAVVPETSVIALFALVAIVPIVWWVLRRANPTRAALALLAISAATIWTTGHSGIFAEAVWQAQVFLLLIGTALLYVGAIRARPAIDRGPDETGLPALSDLRAIVILVPLMLFAALAWWVWRDIDATGRAQVRQQTASLALQSERLFEVQEALLKSALARVRDRSDIELTSKPSAHAYLKEMAATSPTSETLVILDSATATRLVSSRAFPVDGEDGLELSSLVDAYRDGNSATRSGDVIETADGKKVVPISRRDPRSGRVAISVMPLGFLEEIQETLRAASQDVVALVRADGVPVSVKGPVDGALEIASVVSRSPSRNVPPGLASSPTPAGRANRLWLFQPVRETELLAVYGLDGRRLRSEWLERIVPFGLLALIASSALWTLTMRMQIAAAETAAAREEARNQRQLAEREQRFRAVFDQQCQFMAILAPDGRVLEVNDLPIRVTGVPREAVIGRKFWDAPWWAPLPHVRDDWQPRLEAAARSDVPIVKELEFATADGTIRLAETATTAVRDERGNVSFFILQATDTTDRHAAERNILERELQLRLALEASLTVVFDWDIENDRTRRIVPNSGARQRDGANGDGVPFEAIVDIVYPGDRPLFRANVEKALASSDGVYESEHRILTKNASVRWQYERGQVEFSGDGRPLRLIGISQDVTDRKNYEQHTQLLMREVNHRAKNLLGVVQSIALQTAGDDNEEFVERFALRLQALSANQDLLVKSQWHGIGLENLIRAQLSPFSDPDDERISLSGPPLDVTADAAQPIAMAIHELVTNATKYGALTTGGGAVEVTWWVADDDKGEIGKPRGGPPDAPREAGYRPHEEGHENWLYLQWLERGGPPVDLPIADGFGMIVIRELPAMQLDAKVSLDFAQFGLCWRIACPARRVLDENSLASVEPIRPTEASPS